MKEKDKLGQAGEALAAQALMDHGFRILARNWRGHRGELDIIAIEGMTLVAVEVKTRSSLRFGAPAAGITPEKIARMRRLIGQWIVENPQLLPQFHEIRLDAIAVLLENPQEPFLEHMKGIS